MKRHSKNYGHININININEINKVLSTYLNARNKLIKINSNEYENEPIFTTDNFVGEYAELLICDKLNLEQQIASKGEYDAIDRNNKKYQIKSRLYNSYEEKILKRSGKYEFGSVKKINGEFEFDYLVLVYFIENFNNPKIYLIQANEINNILPGEKPIVKKGNEIIEFTFRYNNKYFNNGLKNGLIKEL